MKSTDAFKKIKTEISKLWYNGSKNMINKKMKRGKKRSVRNYVIRMDKRIKLKFSYRVLRQ